MQYAKTSNFKYLIIITDKTRNLYFLTCVLEKFQHDFSLFLNIRILFY